MPCALCVWFFVYVWAVRGVAHAGAVKDERARDCSWAAVWQEEEQKKSKPGRPLPLPFPSPSPPLFLPAQTRRRRAQPPRVRPKRTKGKIAPEGIEPSASGL